MSEYDYMFKDGNLIGISHAPSDTQCLDVFVCDCTHEHCTGKRHNLHASHEEKLPSPNAEEGPWFKIHKNTVIKTVQIQGNSGIYIVETDYISGEVLRDDRPWQMTV